MCPLYRPPLLILSHLPHYNLINSQIKWCGFTLDQTEFITLTESIIRVWNAESGRPVRSVEFELYDGNYSSKGAVHPDGEHFAVSGVMTVYWFRIDDLTEVAKYTGRKSKKSESITDQQFSLSNRSQLIYPFLFLINF